MKVLIVLGLILVAKFAFASDEAEGVVASMESGVSQSAISYEQFMRHSYNGKLKPYSWIHQMVQCIQKGLAFFSSQELATPVDARLVVQSSSEIAHLSGLGLS